MNNKSYYNERIIKNTEKIRLLLRELPEVCREYFMSISQTTSVLTRLAYAYDLRLFFQFICDEEITFANSSPASITISDIAKISAKEINHFQDYLIQYVKLDEKNDSTLVQNGSLGIMRKLCSLRSFFEYLFKNELIESNVTTLVDLPKKKDKPIIFFTDDEAQQLIDTVNSGEGFSEKQKKYLECTKNRDLAIIMMFLGTGIRVSELVGLNLDDIDFNDNAFVITRKGGNQTVLYFPDSVKEVLLKYYDERLKIESDDENSSSALFLSLQKKRITTRAVENLVKKYAAVATPLKKKISPHKLRSTFGTSLYQKTGDIYLVADALGHADVNTTRKHYAAMSDKRKREAAKKIELPVIESIEKNENKEEK